MMNCPGRMARANSGHCKRIRKVSRASGTFSMIGTEPWKKPRMEDGGSRIENCDLSCILAWYDAGAKRKQDSKFLNPRFSILDLPSSIRDLRSERRGAGTPA